MEICNQGEYEFCVESFENNINVVFSTSKGNLNFNKNIDEGIINLKKLEQFFEVDKVIFLNQVHGTRVHTFDNSENIINIDGDGLITNEKNCAIGVFTADCVPVILVDESKQVVAALHSGWKGTLNNIVREGFISMSEKYGCEAKDIKAIIGPHNKVCCYEVSEELINTFKGNEIFKDHEINVERKLNLQKCIELELVNLGIMEDNIQSLNLCTACSKDVKLYSYRNPEQTNGRLFSFVFIKG